MIQINNEVISKNIPTILIPNAKEFKKKINNYIKEN